MKEFVIIQIRNGRPVAHFTGPLEGLALFLLKQGFPAQAQKVATATGTVESYRSLEDGAIQEGKKHPADGWYLGFSGLVQRD